MKRLLILSIMSLSLHAIQTDHMQQLQTAHAGIKSNLEDQLKECIKGSCRKLGTTILGASTALGFTGYSIKQLYSPLFTLKGASPASNNPGIALIAIGATSLFGARMASAKVNGGIDNAVDILASQTEEQEAFKLDKAKEAIVASTIAYMTEKDTQQQEILREIEAIKNNVKMAYDDLLQAETAQSGASSSARPALDVNSHLEKHTRLLEGAERLLEALTREKHA